MGPPSLSPELEHDSCRQADVILSIVVRVGKSRLQVLGFNGTDGQVRGDVQIEAPAHGNSKGILRAKGGEGIGKPSPAKQDLGIGPDLALPAESDSGSEQV